MSEPTKLDWDTEPQIDMFDVYCEDTIHNRFRVHEGYSYREEEWEAFQYGWNAAKEHFGVKE
jgi:hypothetical protein